MMKSCWLAFLLFVLIQLRNEVESAKILFISPSLSNSILMLSGRVSDVLVESGHDVTFWIPEMVHNNVVNGTKLARIVRTNNVSNAFENLNFSKADHFEPLSNIIFSYFHAKEAMTEYCRALYERKEDLEMLRSENFDLAFTDLIDLCFFGLPQYLNISRHIWLSTGAIPDLMSWVAGIPRPLGYMPTFEDSQVGPVMGFWERAHNTFMAITQRLILSYVSHAQSQLLQNYGIQNLNELVRQTSIWFTVNDEFIGQAVPTLDKVINIAGVGINRQPQKLSQNLSELLERGRKGAVYFSLGTATSTIPLSPRKKKALFKAFAAFPDFQFIAKVDKNDEMSYEIAQEIPNLQLVTWVPQIDLLGDSRIKLFISHGGLNSVMESAIRAVPMIIIPLFFDQFWNAKTVEYRGYGLVLDREKIEETYVEQLIHEVLYNEVYKQRAKRLSKLFWSKPNRPEQMIIQWTNFVLENGDLPELIPVGARMGLIEYFCIDVFAVAFITFVVFFYVIVQLVKRLFAILISISVAEKSKME